MANMKFIALTLTLSAIFNGTTAREVDTRTDYLHHVMDAARLRPQINGELNFSPHEREFSNIVRSIIGKRG